MLNTGSDGETNLRATRRDFLKSAAVLGVTAPMLTSARRGEGAATARPPLAFVGTYSSPQGPEGSAGRGEGIYLFEMDPMTGVLTQRDVFRNASNPSYLALDPSHSHLYSGNETNTFEGESSGSVSAYSIDRSNGHLKLINTVSSGGAGPAYLSVHPSGKYVLVANYAGGTVAVIPIGPNGEAGAAACIKHDHGPTGPAHASSAPPGSFAISGHDKPHAHMVQSDPAGRYVISTDLGMDRILVWKFDLATGTISPNDHVALPPGDGPRHFVFHPNGLWFYSVQEEGSTVALFDYNPARGTLKAKQTVSSLPPGFAGTNFPSEIRISSDGRFVYAANRLHDSIAYYSVGDGGKLKFQGEEWTRGDYPRSFEIDPTGNFLYSCNQRSDAITTFQVNRETGALTFTGHYTPVGTPAVIVFL